ncbi:MAG: carbohydrate ABC transporter permease [Oscillospiraceae bacterium]|nr:carbohydrate ABC transporter permease [Oscillospiraceae bacterium]
MAAKKKTANIAIFIILFALALLFLYPIFVVLMNSFKSKLYIATQPFAFPSLLPDGNNAATFVGFTNYINGIVKTNFMKAFGYSAFITVFSVGLIVLFTSMTAWYITRVKSRITSTLYYLFVFSMIVPFQMVMFSMSKVASMLHLDNPVGILFLYLGFGSGLSVFMFSGFVKSIPLDIEEAATIDGCNPIQIFFRIVFPILKPTAITVAILNAMWVWNDYLLPLLVIGNDYKTIPVAVQGVLTGSYGSKDMGALMAMLVISIIPIIIFYLSCQKHIIKGVVAGAVKG